MELVAVRAGGSSSRPLGRMSLDRVGRGDAAAWFDAASRERAGSVNRALEILRAVTFRAEEWGSWLGGASHAVKGGRAVDAAEEDMPEPFHPAWFFLRVAGSAPETAGELKRQGPLLHGVESRWPR